MEIIRSRRDGKVLEIVIDRPKANAIDAALSMELGRTFAEFRDDDSLLVAIMTGAGEKFSSAGWDLKSGAESGELTRGQQENEADLFAQMRQGRFPLYRRALDSEDAKEGLRAFSQKRPPIFRRR